MEPICKVCSRPIKDGEPYIEVKVRNGLNDRETETIETIRVHAIHFVTI